MIAQQTFGYSQVGYDDITNTVCIGLEGHQAVQTEKKRGAED